MASNTPQNYRTLGQAPLDAKLIFKDKEQFDALVLASPVAYAFDFYKGMKVYFQHEERMYIWESPFSDFYRENRKLLDENYIYPEGSIYEGLDYSGRAFNLIEIPYMKPNLGVWTEEDDEKTVIVEIFEGSNVNNFKSEEVLALWPTTERIAFVGGNTTGIKLLGGPIVLFQEFPVSDWDNLTYDIWNSTPGFMQDAKIRLIEPGEIMDYSVYENEVVGNSFQEVRIVHNNTDMVRKNSLFFKPSGTSFEIHVIDKTGVRRSFFGQGSSPSLSLDMAQTYLRLLDANNQVVSQVQIKIENILNLQNELNDRIKKPTGNLLEPNLEFKYLAILDEFGESRRILASYFSSGGLEPGDIIGTANQTKIVNVGNGVLRVALEDSVIIPQNLTIMGNLAVKGDTTVIDVEELKIEDNIITLNSNVLPPQTPVANSGLEISRGAEKNVYLIYNETIDRWTFTNDGVVFHPIPTEDEYSNSSRTYSVLITSLVAVVPHPLNTKKVMVQLYDTTTGDNINSSVKRIDNNLVEVQALTDYLGPIDVLMVKIG